MENLYKIKELTLAGFKCYSGNAHKITFGDKLTVIIGLNGAGKTSLLQALKKALSIILTKDARKKSFVGDGKNIHANTLKSSDATYPFEFAWVPKEPDYKVSLSCSGVIYDTPIDWAIVKDGKGKDSQKPFREALDLFVDTFNHFPAETPLPLLAYFSDSFPHTRNDMSGYEKFVLDDKVENIERRAGYYRWDEDNTDFYFWEGLFIKATRKLNDFDFGLVAVRTRLENPHLPEADREFLNKTLDRLRLQQIETEYVSTFLKKFSEPLRTQDNRGMQVESVGVGARTFGKRSDAVLKVNFLDGSFRFFDMLPEGYKRLFSIVFEISYRYFILNRNLILASRLNGTPYTDLAPEGIVLIDELELHLHPTLVEEVALRLRKTFPKVQFIISSHSPAVVANVRNDGQEEIVVSLTPDHNFEVVEKCFGADYGDTLVNHMGAYGRMHMLQVLKQLVRESIEDDDERDLECWKEELLKFFDGHANEAYVNALIESIRKDVSDHGVDR